MKRVFLLLLIPILFAGCQAISRRDRLVLQAHNVPQDVYDRMSYGDPLSLDDIIALSQRRVPSGLIINYMEDSDTAYRLAKADMQHLRSAGVDEEVIAYMLSTSAPPNYAGGYPYAPPYAYPYPYYPYDYYGGPVVVGGYNRWGGWGRGGYYHHH